MWLRQSRNRRGCFLIRKTGVHGLIDQSQDCTSPTVARFVGTRGQESQRRKGIHRTEASRNASDHLPGSAIPLLELEVWNTYLALPIWKNLEALGETPLAHLLDN